MSRGGRRPGAGAPKGNLNSLKNGEYSMQLRQALNGSSVKEWHDFLFRLKDDRFRARVNMSATIFWLRNSSL
jgi:hypothetical protein